MLKFLIGVDLSNDSISVERLNFQIEKVTVTVKKGLNLGLGGNERQQCHCRKGEIS